MAARPRRRGASHRPATTHGAEAWRARPDLDLGQSRCSHCGPHARRADAWPLRHRARKRACIAHRPNERAARPPRADRRRRWLARWLVRDQRQRRLGCGRGFRRGRGPGAHAGDLGQPRLGFALGCRSCLRPARPARADAFRLPRPRRVAVARDAARLARRDLTLRRLTLVSPDGCAAADRESSTKGGLPLRRMDSRLQAGMILKSRLHQLRRPAISLSQGAEWKAPIMKYMGTIPLMSAPCPDAEQSGSAPPPRQTVISAIVTKAGAAARPRQSAAIRAIAAPWLPAPIEIALIAVRLPPYFGTRLLQRPTPCPIAG